MQPWRRRQIWISLQRYYRHRLESAEEFLIINKVISDAFILCFHDTYIFVHSHEIHIKMCLYLIMDFTLSLMHIYFGRMTLQSKYLLSKHLGNEPTTSARPPVLINGTPSEATNNIFFISRWTPSHFLLKERYIYLNYTPVDPIM